MFVSSQKLFHLQKVKSSHFICLTRLLLLFALWLQCSAMDAMNPPVCGARSFDDQSLNLNCRYGGHIINPNPVSCKDRYVCYRGPGQFCNYNEELKCGKGLTCKCDKCQGCFGEICDNTLCPSIQDNDIIKRLMKRFEHMQKLPYNN